MSQQTPSTQKPEPHSVPLEQVVEIGLEQVPSPLAEHVMGAAHEATEQQTPSTQLPLVH